MMSRKRSLRDADACGDVMVLDTNSMLDNNIEQSTHKRCCGTSRHPAPGELSAQEIAAYLHTLSNHLQPCTYEYAGQVLPAEGWQAFAELNLLLNGYVATSVPGSALLKGYHSFTLQPRARLWSVYSNYAASRGKQSPQQLELVKFLLEWVLSPYPDCSLTEVTLSLPPWMVSWASRWGMSSSNNRITLIMLEAYPPSSDPCCSHRTSNLRKPARKLFVPALL